MKKYVNGELKDMTPAEVSQWNADSEKDLTMIAEMKAEIEAKEALKASAKAKLIAGEALTAEEADTIVL